MKKSFIFSLMLILIFSTLLSADNLSTLNVGNLNAKIAYVPGELLVKYKTQFSAAASSFYKTNWNISTIRTFKSIGCQHVKLPQGMTVEQAMDMFRNDPNVEYAEPNYIYHATLTPNDTSFTQLWGLNNTGQNVNGTSGTNDADIDATEAWDNATGSDTVVIAVIDSGVKWDHEDLVGNIWSNIDEIPGNGIDDDGNGYIDDIRGWDFVDDDNDPMDYNHHGTHVAGTIAAVGNNSLGVTGVCWTAKIMPLRGLDTAGSGYSSDLIAAIEYANANGAHVINNSWGGGGESQATKDAIDASSAVVVCAAGNSNDDNDAIPHYPSSYDSTNIIAVAATDQNDDLASFSCYGATSVDVAAPGVNIYSTSIAYDDVWIDDFNDGNISGWSTGGTIPPWGIENNYIADSPYVDYVSFTDSWIMTGPINLADEPAIMLEFQLMGESEYGWDFLYIQTSSDGSIWTNQAQLHGSTNGAWFSMKFDISTYAGGNVYIRFRFTSDVIINYEGWNIDDVKVTAFSNSNLNSYEYLQGTSMAAPIVSGIAGLVKANSPTLTNIEIKALIEDNVDPVGLLSGIVATGGRVNVNNIPLATAPNIDVSPTSLDIDIMANNTDTRTLNIGNIGGADLIISDIGDNAAWLSQSPTNGTVSPGGNLPVQVTFDATGMSTGTYNAVIEIQSNDPDEDVVSIPVTMNVIYDATGTWNYTETSVFDSCDPAAQPGSGTVTVTQTGNTVTMVDDEGNTFTGTVSASTYTLSGTYPEDDGITIVNIIFTLSSATSGSGTSTWTWTGPGGPCNGNSVFTITKQGSSPPPGSDGSDGGVCFISTAAFGL